MQEFVNRLKRYEIHIRSTVANHLHGDFNSVFKGSGLDFDEVRAYNYGDEVRHINWNVTAKGQGTFINTFKEEKEQNIFLVLDVSASQKIGHRAETKLNIAKDIVGVLALSAVKEKSAVGFYAFSDQKESYVKFNKGYRHTYEILRRLFYLKPESHKTNIEAALDFSAGILKRKSIVIFVSDFIDESQYDSKLKALAKRHDLIVIHVTSPQEQKFPKLGIIPVYDQEAQKIIWRNTSSVIFRRSVKQFYQDKVQSIKTLCQKYKISYVHIDATQNFIPKLVGLFNLRKRLAR